MYAPLKVTTDYSILKSLIRIDSLIDFLLKNNIGACAICDDNLYGAREFYLKCTSNNIKPIIGLSVLIEKQSVYLYAINYAGYQNLLKIHTIMQTKDIIRQDLELYKENVAIIIPYESISLYEKLLFFNDVYVGYKTSEEKKKAMDISRHVLFVNDLRALEALDIQYLEYLDKLRKEPKKDYTYNYYVSSSLVEYESIQKFVDLFDFHFPVDMRYIPKYSENVNSLDFLNTLAHKGLEKRLKNKVPKTYLDRLEYELDVINKLGFVDYFLIVYDYVFFAKKNGILVGPGRGSAAGSLVSYALGITEIDPLQYGLLFERFLNPQRVTMPDIDIDFDASKRDEVIDYVRNKYGKNKVALGITFNTLKSKLVLREVGRILYVDANLIDKFVKEIDGNLDLKSNLRNKTVEIFLNHYKELEKVYKVAMKLEKIKKNISTHAAGVVISSVSLDDVIPICINNEVVLTGFPMEYLEDLGLLKMDFLGLKNLTIIDNILRRINGNVLKNINLEDQRVYTLLQSGKTEGIFQLETSAMQSLVMKLKPSCFNDLVAAVALGRPGPKEHVPDFIKRKNKETNVSYLHEDLKPILEETYGIMLYQEQIIAILVKFASYSYGEADVIRRAISKKKKDDILRTRDDFLCRVVNNGYEKEIGEEIYQQIAEFASYGFNKSHSVAYALIAYQMAYLKVYYPLYFVIELLNGNSLKNDYYLSYLKQKGILLKKASVNSDNWHYDFKDNCLTMPLYNIRNLSKDVALKIWMKRDKGYQDIFDFVIKTKDFMTLELASLLIHAGALDCFSFNHQTMVMNMESLLNYASLVGDSEDLLLRPTVSVSREYDENFLRKKELESYGFYVTNHPASKYSKEMVLKMAFMNKFLFKKVVMVVVLESIRMIKTKKREDMAFFSGSDETGIGDFTVFPNVYDDFKKYKVGDLVRLTGEVTKRFEKIGMIVKTIEKMED